MNWFPGIREVFERSTFPAPSRAESSSALRDLAPANPPPLPPPFGPPRSRSRNLLCSLHLSARHLLGTRQPLLSRTFLAAATLAPLLHYAPTARLGTTAPSLLRGRRNPSYPFSPAPPSVQNPGNRWHRGLSGGRAAQRRPGSLRFPFHRPHRTPLPFPGRTPLSGVSRLYPVTRGNQEDRSDRLAQCDPLSMYDSISTQTTEPMTSISSPCTTIPRCPAVDDRIPRRLPEWPSMTITTMFELHRFPR